MKSFKLAHPKGLVESPKNCETTEQDWQVFVKSRDAPKFRLRNFIYFNLLIIINMTYSQLLYL